MEGQVTGAPGHTDATVTPAAGGAKKTTATARLKLEYKINPDEAQTHVTALVAQLRETGVVVTAEITQHEPRKAAI